MKVRERSLYSNSKTEVLIATTGALKEVTKEDETNESSK
jgi:hypothetical protein